MDVTLVDQSYNFRPWKPDLGRVFNSTLAFDCETVAISKELPWFTPAYVLGAGFDGQRGFFVPRQHATAFFQAHAGVPLVFHHTAFDLDVLSKVLADGVDLYKAVDEHRVWDTELLHRLYLLGRAGHTGQKKGEATLEHCAQLYLGVELPKDVLDSKGNLVRLGYGQWLNRPPQEIEPIYLDYLAKDAIATFLVYQELRRGLDEQLKTSKTVWGFVSDAWLKTQLDRWGPQTHHIQLKASIVLRSISANGLTLDLKNKDSLAAEVDAVLEQKRAELRGYGYLPGCKRPGKALQGIMRRLEQENPGVRFPRTDTGKYATSRAVLEELSGLSTFIRTLLEYRAVEKIRGSFLDKMVKPVLHPSFSTIKNTGRTSSFGEINAQNLPRNDQIRGCFIPSRGRVFIDADYATVELATLAAAVQSQFGLVSKMAEAINEGADLHRRVASQVTGKPEGEVTKGERQQAKPINFGKPGGMGNRKLQQYAKASYGVELSDEQVEQLSEAWIDLFPEMQEFLHQEREIGLEIADFFNLTPVGHYRHTEDERFLSHRNNFGREDRPHSILGSMCLKVLRDENPTKKDGEPYSADDVEYFWSAVEARLDALPKKHRAAVSNRRPSAALEQAVRGLVGREPVFTLTGRLRAAANFCERHNTIFQGLAADGAKLALWELWRADYRIANFIHDQFLVEVPEDSDLTQHAERIKQLMIDGMQAVVPDVRIDVEYTATRRWLKTAKPCFDAAGRLQVYEPNATEASAPNAA